MVEAIAQLSEILVVNIRTIRELLIEKKIITVQEWDDKYDESYKDLKEFKSQQ